MTMNKLLGVLLLLVAIAFTVGLVIDVTSYWFDLDYVTIAICGVSGLILLKGK